MEPMLREALGKTRRLRQQVEDVLLGPDGDEWERELKNFLAKRPCWVKEKTKPQRSDFLRLLTTEPPVIGACSGRETLALAHDVFGYIDPNFKNWELNEPDRDTPDTPVAVHELIKDGCFGQFFRLLGELDKLCLTQNQIKKFCVNHKAWLQTEGYSTFFLFKKNGKFFVADVDFDCEDRLSVSVRHLSDDYVWLAEYRRRIVVPQLAA